MTHSHLSAPQLADAGISWTTVRLSIGLEDPRDIVADLEQALAGVAPAAAQPAQTAAAERSDRPAQPEPQLAESSAR